jgi:hypothetical protein
MAFGAERLEHARPDEEDDNDAGRQAGMMMRQQHGDDGRLECIRSLSFSRSERAAARIIVRESGGRREKKPYRHY